MWLFYVEIVENKCSTLGCIIALLKGMFPKVDQNSSLKFFLVISRN